MEYLEVRFWKYLGRVKNTIIKHKESCFLFPSFPCDVNNQSFSHTLHSLSFSLVGFAVLYNNKTVQGISFQHTNLSPENTEDLNLRSRENGFLFPRKPFSLLLLLLLALSLHSLSLHKHKQQQWCGRRKKRASFLEMQLV